jgi:nucleoside-diphosphate-sugar epimerase
MTKRIFLAGASGVIGRVLIRRLLQDGHSVVGTTRSPEKLEMLQALGAKPVLVDVFDREALMSALAAARPQVVVHQLTDLPDQLDPARMPEHVVRNARIRAVGTRNLVDCALTAGAERFVAQSIAWAYAPGPTPQRETDALDLMAQGTRAVTVNGIVALEDAVLRSPLITGVVLRYGAFYGEGTGFAIPQANLASLHVDAAADAAALAIERGAAGIYNVADPNPWVATDRARQELGWVPADRSST